MIEIITKQNLILDVGKLIINFKISACTCDVEGSMSIQCDQDTGLCPCYPNVVGENCEYCELGRKHFPDCLPCDCDPNGSVDQNCDPVSGICPCIERVEGNQCTNCTDGYYDLDGSLTCEGMYEFCFYNHCIYDYLNRLY